MDCSKCLFKEVTPASGGLLGGPQVGCHANRIHRFSELGQAEYADGYYELKRFCSMYRPTDWLEDEKMEFKEKLFLFKQDLFNDSFKTSLNLLNRYLPISSLSSKNFLKLSIP